MGGEGTSNEDVAAPPSPAVTHVNAENAAADEPKPKADESTAQAVAEQKTVAKKSVGSRNS